ncbi:MAG TPA: DUF3240 family protein [Rhodocyclaceae bacterium]
MKPYDISLNLILPKSLEERVSDFLLDHPEQVGPFIAYPVDGHGAPESMTANAEAVRGRAQRVKIEVLARAADARQLVAAMRAAWPQTAITYWLGAVQEAGSFE